MYRVLIDKPVSGMTGKLQPERFKGPYIKIDEELGVVIFSEEDDQHGVNGVVPINRVIYIKRVVK